ncbi:MAG: hypothetical protein WKG00_08285 [Polyangiaceae bacterium]
MQSAVASSPPIASPSAAAEPSSRSSLAAGAQGSGTALEAQAQVNAAGTHPKGALRWGYFLVLNAIAGVIAVAMFVGVFYAESLDPYMRGTYEWLLAHPGVTSFCAFSPLASCLLVGWGYSSRARKRKAAAARAAAADAARAPDGAASLVSARADASTGPRSPDVAPTA